MRAAPLPPCRDRRTLPVVLRVTPRNRNSLAAVLSVLEAELAPQKFSCVMAASHQEIPAGPALVLYSFMTDQVGEVRKELAFLDARDDAGAFLVAGGPHPSGDPDGTLALGFPWVVIGEAGPELGQLVRLLLQGVTPAPGIVREKRQRRLDTYPPWPASLPLFSQLEISRGCALGCTFCQTPTLHGRVPRHRSVPTIRQALLRSVEHQHKYTRFVAPNAFAYGAPDSRHPNPRAIEALLLCAKDCGLRQIFFGTFPSEVRPESVRPEILRLVRDLCDNRTIAVGLQSGSDSVLERLRRGHSVREGLDAVAQIARAGFRPRVDFLFGLPGETNADRRQTRELIRHIAQEYGAQVHAHLFQPLPGTPLQAGRPSPIDPQTRDLLRELRGRGLATGAARA